MPRIIHVLLVTCLGLLNAVAGVPVRFCLLTAEMVAEPAGADSCVQESQPCCPDCSDTPETPGNCCLRPDWTVEQTPCAKIPRPHPPWPAFLPAAGGFPAHSRVESPVPAPVRPPAIPLPATPDLLAALGSRRL